MLKYLVILLDKTSVAYCHADNPYKERELISIPLLKDAIFWAMKENLMIQFVYPDYELPAEYLEVIDTIDHVDIRPDSCGDVCVYDSLDKLPDQDIAGKNVVARLTLRQLVDGKDEVVEVLKKAQHLSVVLTDVARSHDREFDGYKKFLSSLAKDVEAMYAGGYTPQLNLLTDRMALSGMNNCNAGWESLTLAPNGRFYICPAFYYENEADSVGGMADGPSVKNPQLYQLKYAPICRGCDAWQCRRCVWLNRKLTLEVNTPGREQCVMAHVERNASRELLGAIRSHGEFLPGTEIPEIDYIDPFDKIVNR